MMDETRPLALQAPTSNERTVMHVLYGMHTVAWLSLGMLAVFALVANYILRGETRHPLYLAHHAYMIATFWWTVLWLVITSPLYLLFVLPGVVAQCVVGLWYLYRCLRGWLRFNNATLPRGNA